MFLCWSFHYYAFDIFLPSKPSHFINYGLTKFSVKKESKGPAQNEKVVQENITVSKPAAQVMSEIPLESIFNDVPYKESEVFIEKGSNGGETKEAKPGELVSSTSTRVVTTSRTVVKSDGSSPVTTVEKKVIVNGEEQPLDRNLLSPPAVEVDVEEKEDGSEEGTVCTLLSVNRVSMVLVT